MSENKVVNSFWFGESLSKLELLSVNSFVKHGYTYNLYVYEDKKPDNIPKTINVKDASSIVDRDNVFFYENGFNKGSVSGFANFFRYVLISKIGGIWTDTDIVLLSDSLEFGEENHSFIIEDDMGHMANSLFKAPEDSKILNACASYIKKRDPSEFEHGETGPKLITRAVRSFQGGDVNIYKKEDYFPFHWEDTRRLFYDDLPIQRTWKTIHFWNACINDAGIDKNRKFPSWSIYEKLKELYL